MRFIPQFIVMLTFEYGTIINDFTNRKGYLLKDDYYHD